MPFQILSLSGGGYLGLYTVAVLAEIETQTGKRAVDMFDLLAGTSIGGIIALGLASGVSAVEIRDAFLEHGNDIFGHSAPSRGVKKLVDFIANIPTPKYRSTALKKTVEGIVGEGSLMKGLRRPTIVTAVNLTKGGPKVFKTGHHPLLMLDWRLPVVDVALATSAAPTYFPTHQIGGEIYADGGMFANSPDLIATHEAEHFLDVASEELRVLSVGTTTTCFAFSASAPVNMGVWDWAANDRLTNAIIGSQQALTHDMMRHKLNERYVRIDRMQADDQRRDLALDCASDAAKATLLAMARLSVAEASRVPMLREMLRHESVDRPFINATI